MYHHSQLLTLNLRFMNLHKVIKKKKKEIKEKKRKKQRKKHTWLVCTVFLFCEFLILCELSPRPFGFITSTPSLSFWGMTRPEILSVQIKSWKPFSRAVRTDLHADACASLFRFTSTGEPETQCTELGFSSPCTITESCWSWMVLDWCESAVFLTQTHTRPWCYPLPQDWFNKFAKIQPFSPLSAKWPIWAFPRLLVTLLHLVIPMQ